MGGVGVRLRRFCFIVIKIGGVKCVVVVVEEVSLQEEEREEYVCAKKNVQRTTRCRYHYQQLLKMVKKTTKNLKKRTKRRRALEIVQMWRVRGRVPLAIDAHAQIVELQLMDEEVMREKKRRRNESTLRLSYAMTLTRLVNGICDPSQKGKFAVSVQTLATQLNVPRTLVDIRHDSTHNQLPSIQRLRKASEDAIGWLDANYWERQKRKLEHVTEEMRLVIRAMVECERGQNVKKSKDESNSSDDDESMYDSEEEMHAKTEKANKMKREKETRKKTKNSAVGRLKRLVPRSKPDRMLVHAFVRELLDAKEEEMLLIVENSSYDKTDPDEDLGEKNNTDEIVRAFSNVIDQIDSRVVDGFSCAILEFGTEELLHDLANDARQIINPIFEFAWKHAVSRDVAKATFIAEWYQRRGNDSVRGSNTSEYVQNKFQTLLSLDGVGGAIAADGGGSKNKKKNAKTQNNNKKRQKEEEDTIAWRKAKPGEWIPGAPIGAPIRALFPPRELGDEGDDEKIVLESDSVYAEEETKNGARARHELSYHKKRRISFSFRIQRYKRGRGYRGRYRKRGRTAAKLCSSARRRGRI